MMDMNNEKQISKLDFKGINFNKKYYWLAAGVLSAFFAYIGFFLAGMLFGGDYIIQRGDLLESHIPYIKMFCRQILQGESIWYSPNISMGMNTSLVLAYYALSPFNILYFIFNKADDNIITAIIILLKVGCAASFFQLFSKKVLKNDGFLSVFFSICYALCGFSVAYCFYHIMWFDGFLLLPVLCLAIVFAVERGNYIPLTLCYIYLIISQFYIGYISGVFSVLFLLGYLAFSFKRFGGKRCIRIILFSLLSVLLAILVSAIVWLPALMFLLNHRAPDNTGFDETTAITLIEVVNSLFCNQYRDNYGSFSYSYTGIPVLLMIPFYFTNRKIAVKERVISGLVVLFLMICYLFPPMYQFMHAFDAPDFFWYRFSFLLSFVLCVISVRQAKYWKDINIIHFAIYAFVLVFLYAIEQRFEILGKRTNSPYNSTNLMLNLGLIVIWGTFIFMFRKVKKNSYKTLCFLMIIFLGIEEVININSFLIGKTDEKEYYEWKSFITSGVDTIHTLEEDNDFYRVIVDDDYSHNSDSLFGYNGVCDFGSAENYELRSTMGKLGFGTSPRLTCASGYNPASGMLLGVRYYLFPPNADSVNPNEVQSPILVINKNALRLGFMVEDEVADYEFLSRNVFDNTNDLLKRMTGTGIECFSEIPEEEVKYICDNGSIYNSGAEGVRNVAIKINDKSGYLDVVIPNDRNKYNDLYIQFQSEFSAADETDYKTYGFNMVNGTDFGLSMNESIKMNYDAESNEYVVRVRASNDNGTERVLEGINCYSFDQSALEELYSNLSKEQLEIEEFKAGYIRGKIRVESNRRILFTTVPYDDSWTVRLNGVRVTPLATIGKAFLAIELPDDGDYTVEMKYEAPGVKAGCGMSISGVIILAIYFAFTIVKKKRGTMKSEVDDHEHIG